MTNNSSKKQSIKYVAIYLRKSRDDGEMDVLNKHRATLFKLATENNWQFNPNEDVYEEVVSGERLECRYQMQSLLKALGENAYDGVLVMDIDRLGRGELVEWAYIKRFFQETETLIITPSKIYDLESDSDDLQFNIESILSNLELKKIVERLQGGKVATAEKGKWVNGFAPFPYYYDRINRTLQVDELRRPYYRKMVEMYINGYNLIDIARYMTDNLPTKYNITNEEDKRKGWSTVVIRHLLANELHLGIIVYGKFRKRRKKSILLPPEEWKRVQGEHEALKTEEEHAAIMARITKSKQTPTRTRMNSLPLSGLLYCEKCGGRMGVRYVDGVKWRLHCDNRDINNIKCTQKGKHFDESFVKQIYDTVVKIDVETLFQMNNNQKEIDSTKKLLNAKNKELEKTEKALGRVYELFEEGDIEKTTFLERKKIRKTAIDKIRAEINELMVLLEAQADRPTLERFKYRLKLFKDQWFKAENAKEQNVLLSTLVYKIYYNREKRMINLNIQYK